MGVPFLTRGNVRPVVQFASVSNSFSCAKGRASSTRPDLPEARMDDPRELQRLLAAVREGDTVACAELYNLFGPVVRAAVRQRLHPQLRTRFDSLDFVQDVWASFWKDAAEPREFPTAQALVRFLTRIAEYKVVEVFRQRFEGRKDDIRRERPIDGVSEGVAAGGGSPSQLAIAGEEWERILSRFTPGHRVILERLREGHSEKDIARLANVGLRTVERVVRRLKDITGI